MRIVVQLTPDAAGRHRPLAWLPHSLRPIHPRGSDSPLDTFFEVEVDDPVEGERLLEQLRCDPAVTAAYVKPEDELPSM